MASDRDRCSAYEARHAAMELHHHSAGEHMLLVMLARISAENQALERILYVWAIRHPASGYVQGINDLVCPFFQVFLSAYIGEPPSRDRSLSRELMPRYRSRAVRRATSSSGYIISYRS